MKKGFLFAAVLLAASCASPPPNEETLLRYAKSRDVYGEGRFAEAALMLTEEKKFVPALVLRGKAEFLSGNLEAAEKTLEHALELKSDDTESSLFLARLYRETGRAKEAQKLSDAILGRDPGNIRALRFAAVLSDDRGVSGEAASAALLDRAVEASSEASLVFLDRAKLRWKGGNRSGALEDLGRARVLVSGDSPVMKAVERLESIIKELSL